MDDGGSHVVVPMRGTLRILAGMIVSAPMMMVVSSATEHEDAYDIYCQPEESDRDCLVETDRNRPNEA
jgi:hypothetical protein